MPAIRCDRGSLEGEVVPHPVQRPRRLEGVRNRQIAEEGPVERIAANPRADAAEGESFRGHDELAALRER